MAGFGMPTTLLQAIGDRIQANVMAIQTFVDASVHGFVHKYLHVVLGLDGQKKGGTPDPHEHLKRA